MRSSRRRRRSRYSDSEELNPMNYVSNLSDVMLILAVGIMLALILHWNVQIDPQESATDTQNNQAVSFSDEDLESKDELPEDMEHMGEVYYDAENKTYYIIQNNSNEE